MDPYRSTEIESPVAPREVSVCSWCANGPISSASPLAIVGPPSPWLNCYGDPCMAGANDSGECESYQPSLMTRIVRRRGRRGPIIRIAE